MNLPTGLIGAIIGPSGKVSNIRVVSLAIPMIVVLTWAYVSVKRLELQPLAEWQVALALGPIAAKAWQKKAEGGQSTP